MTGPASGPTDPRQPGDWDETRLRAAFVARSAAMPPAPNDVVVEVLAQIDQPRRRLLAWPTFAVAGAAVALAIVLAGSTLLRQLQPSPTAGNAAASSQPRLSPDLANPVIEAIGAPLDVKAAITLRDSGSPDRDREIQVEGYLSPLFALPCPMNLETSNPTRVRCPESFQYLMQDPEPLATMSTGGVDLGPPSGPALHPSFALVEPPLPPAAGDAVPAPAPITLLGHFHDRRAKLCSAADRSGCELTFVVDRVVEVDGVQAPIGTIRRTDATPKDLEADVDALVAGAAPAGFVEARRLVPIAELIPLEPILTDDQVIPHIGNPDTLAWIVTTIDLVDGTPMARTFVLLDGSNWFAEITAAGTVMHDRSVPAPTGGPQIVPPTADPAAFKAAPTTILGIQVRDIGSMQRDRAAELDQLGRDEFAVRAWYLGPKPSATCADEPPVIHAPTPPCDEARRWLLDDPQQYGIQPGQLRADPSTELYPPVLNPLLPIDVSLDVGTTWDGDTPLPKPVIVLGHFEDTRVNTYAGNVYFVIDALAWTRGGPASSIGSVTFLTAASTESPSSVLERIDAVAPSGAVATWATAVDAADFPALNPYPVPPEFTTGGPIWVVRRLVASEMDGRHRLAIVTAYTADQGYRIWMTPSPDSEADLATTLDLRDLDANTSLVRVYDYGDVIDSVGPISDQGASSWQRLGPVRDLGLDVAYGSSHRDVAIRWKGVACDPTWRLEIHYSPNGTLVAPWQTGTDCEGDTVVRQLIVHFHEPVDIDTFHTTDPCCG